MYCTHCGKQLDNQAVFCPYCGAPVQNALPNKGNIPQGNTPRKTNAFSIAGLATAVLSLALAVIATYINEAHYTGVNFQFFFLIPLAPALVLSIIGTVKSKKLKSGKLLGIAGIIISAFFLGGSIIWFFFGEAIQKLAGGSLFILYLFMFLLG